MSRHSARKTSYSNAHRRNAFEALTGETPPLNLKLSPRVRHSNTVPHDNPTNYMNSSDTDTDTDTVHPDDSISVVATRRQYSRRHSQGSSYDSSHGSSHYTGSHHCSHQSSRHNHAPTTHSRRSSYAYQDDYLPRVMPHRNSVTGSYRQSVHGYPTHTDDYNSVKRPSRTYTYINDDDELVEQLWSDYENRDADLIDRYSRGYDYPDYTDEESELETPKAHSSRAPPPYNDHVPSRSGCNSHATSHPPTSFRFTNMTRPVEESTPKPSRSGGKVGSTTKSHHSNRSRPTSHYDDDYSAVPSHSDRTHRSRRPSHSQNQPNRSKSPEPPRPLTHSTSMSRSSRTVNDQGLAIRRRDDGRLQWERPKNRPNEPAKKRPGDPPKWLLWLAGGA